MCRSGRNNYISEILTVLLVICCSFILWCSSATVSDNMGINRRNLRAIQTSDLHTPTVEYGEPCVSYCRSELHDIKQRVQDNRQLLQIPVTAWMNIRQCRINRRKTRRGTRGGDKNKQRENHGVHTNNLVHVKLIQDHPIKLYDRKLKISTINVQSMRNKHLAYLEHLIVDQIDICVVTEIWLNNLDPTIIADLNTQGYIFKPFVRNRTGGGIALSYRDNITVVEIDRTSEPTSYEHVQWKVTTKHHSFTLLGVYHPPRSQQNGYTNQQFVDHFSTILVPILATSNNILVLGDFNIHVNDINDPDNILLQNWLTAFGLENHVTFPTHSDGNTLDLVISKHKQKLSVLTVKPGISLCDHTEVVICVDAEKTPMTRCETTIRKLDSMDSDKFIAAIKIISTEIQAIDDPDEASSRYQATLTRTLDKLVPSKTVVITKRPQFPWYNDESSQLKRAVRVLERRWLLNRTTENRKDYTELRNIYAKHLWHNKRKIITQRVLDCAKDSKKLYALVNNLVGRVSTNPMPKAEATSQLPDMFADFFLSKIEKIRNNLSNIPTYQPRVRQVQPLGQFHELTEDEIYKTIMTMKIKSCELDPLPAKIFRKYAKQLTPIITHVVNTSIRNNTFPLEWKYSIVKPLLKKPGLQQIEKNYRPVSNLSLISKITEKAVLNQIIVHIDNEAPLPEYQSAYRKNHGCEYALLELQNDILWRLERQQVMAVCTMDLSAAFDTVDHDLLLTVLENRFGVNYQAKEWVDSYLRPRGMKVRVGNDYSTARDTPFGVPQGSCLGPYLYLAYASTLDDVVDSDMGRLSGFADDHGLRKPFSANNREEEICVMNGITNSMETIKNWMDSNWLQMNTSKTELILFGSGVQLSKCVTNSIHIGSDLVERSSSIKYLGVTLDENMTLRKHIILKCQRASYNLHNIKLIRHSLTEDACKQVIYGLVLSHLDYCNGMYMGLPNVDILKMQRVQNAAAKLALQRKWSDSSTDALRALHWLPVQERIKFKILTIVHKCLYDHAPAYMQKLISLKTTTDRYSLRSKNQTKILNEPRTKLKTFADRSFSVYAPRLWNNLPDFLRKFDDHNRFRKALKTYLFEHYFN